jgi:hypothetical protein
MKNFILTLILLITAHSFSYSQEMKINTDSLRQKDSLLIVPAMEIFEIKDILIDKATIPLMDASDLAFDSSFQDQPPALNLDLKYIPPKINYYESEYYTLSPFNFSFDNGYQGGDLMGVNNYFSLTNFLTANLTFSVSSSFIGPMQPERYNNASVSLNLLWQLNDRIRVRTYGQFSLREGINPNLAPMINGGNYYGGEIQVKIFKNVGFGIGVVNSYYRKDWTLLPYGGPVIF